MITGRKTLLLLIAAASLLILCACAGNTRPQSIQTADTEHGIPNSPAALAECVMESLKTLNLSTFNEYTDNYVCTHRNWIGIPTRREYRVFNELLQPVLIKGKHYQRNYNLSQKLTRNLSWEITKVRESDGNAEIDMEITNTDMSIVTGNYVIFLLENMVEYNGTVIGSMLNDLSDLTHSMDNFLSFMDSADTNDTCTTTVTLSAWQENGKWKLHVSNEFIDAFMGNMDSEDYPEEIMLKIKELEKEVDEKADKWANEFEENIEGLFE